MSSITDRIHLLERSAEPAVRGDRNTIGGWPLLAGGEAWPVCFCGTPMVFFFQAEVPAFGGDQLLVFQCPTHDESTWGPHPLPQRYWDVVTEPYEGPFWRILLQPAGTPTPDPDPYVEPSRLVLRPAEEEIRPGDRGLHGFKLGGVPSWAQDPEWQRCACGTDMVLLCQVPENFGFDMWPMRDRDSHGTSDDQAQLFLGNEIYILACPARCHPRATWPVAQN